MHLLPRPRHDREEVRQRGGGDGGHGTAVVVVVAGVEVGNTAGQECGEALVVRGGGVGVDAPPPPGVRAQHHDLAVVGEGGEVRDLHQHGAEEGGGGQLQDPRRQTLALAQRRQRDDLETYLNKQSFQTFDDGNVHVVWSLCAGCDLLWSELSDGESDGLLGCLGRDHHPHTRPGVEMIDNMSYNNVDK